MREALESVLGPLRPGFDADGFDVTVDSASTSICSKRRLIDRR